MCKSWPIPILVTGDLPKLCDRKITLMKKILLPCILLFAANVWGQTAAQPSGGYIYPSGVQQGTTSQVMFYIFSYKLPLAGTAAQTGSELSNATLTTQFYLFIY